MKNMTFVFNANGKRFSVSAPDADRARCAAKRLAGSEWTPKAKLETIKMGGVA